MSGQLGKFLSKVTKNLRFKIINCFSINSPITINKLLVLVIRISLSLKKSNIFRHIWRINTKILFFLLHSFVV
jgi:hypothetical protein